MTKFTASPREVEAFQWTGQPLEAWPKWAQELARGGQHGSLWINGMHLSVDTPQGPARANRGDWVVKDGKTLRAVTNEEFIRNYTSKDKKKDKPAKSNDPPTKEETDETEGTEGESADIEIEEESEASSDAE